MVKIPILNEWWENMEFVGRADVLCVLLGRSSYCFVWIFFALEQLELSGFACALAQPLASKAWIIPRIGGFFY